MDTTSALASRRAFSAMRCRVSLAALVGGEDCALHLDRCAEPFLTSPRFLIEACVLDGHAGRGSQGRDQLLVLVTEAAFRGLGQVQVSEDLVAQPDRHAEKAVHSGMSGRESRRARVLADF